MPPKEVLKYILDIESVISELENVVEIHSKDYTKFSSNFMAIRTVERDLEIIGEALLFIFSLTRMITDNSALDKRTQNPIPTEN